MHEPIFNWILKMCEIFLVQYSVVVMRKDVILKTKRKTCDFVKDGPLQAGLFLACKKCFYNSLLNYLKKNP